MRRRRSVHLVVDLQRLFLTKSVGYTYRFSTLVQGLGLRIARDLVKLFDQDSVHTHFHFVRGDLGKRAMEAEAKVMSELLAD